MAVTTDASSNIIGFYHDADKMTYASGLSTKVATEDGYVGLSTAPRLVTFIAPVFVNLVDATFTFRKTLNDVDTFYYYTTDPQINSVGHILGHSFLQVHPNVNQLTVVCDSSQKINVSASVSTPYTRIGVSTDGWRFPLGM